MLFGHAFVCNGLRVEVVAGRWLICFFVRGHHHLNRLQVGLTGAKPLPQFCIFALQVSNTLLEFVAGVGKP